MNLIQTVKVKFLFLFIFLLFAITGVAYANETSGNASGTITCPDGNSVKGELSFTAFMNDSPVYGSWEVVVDDSSENKISNGGYLSSGNIDDSDYDLEGTETTTSICGLDTNANISIHGACGNKGKIQIRADTGWSGIFGGNIACGSQS